MKFLKEVYSEMVKVIWPSREKTTIYTIAVLIVSLFVAYYLSLFDFVFQGIGLKNLL